MNQAVQLVTVSIVIPHYGNPAPTLELARNLLNQAEPSCPIQIVVVDDCSPTPFPTDTPGVEVVRQARNGGFGSSVNAGVRISRGDLLLILNSDLEIPTSFVSDLVSASLPWMPAVTSPRVVDRAGKEMWTGRQFPRIRHQATEWLVPLARARSHGHLNRAIGRDARAHDAGGDTAVDFVVGAAMLVPRSVFTAAGGFDERFFMNSEEADLQRRLRQEGVISVALHHPVVVHEGGGSSDPNRRRAWIVASRLKYAEKWGHPRALRAALTGATGINLLWNGMRQLAGRDVKAPDILRNELKLIWSNPLGEANEPSSRTKHGS